MSAHLTERDGRRGAKQYIHAGWNQDNVHMYVSVTNCRWYTATLLSSFAALQGNYVHATKYQQQWSGHMHVYSACDDEKEAMVALKEQILNGRLVEH